MKKCDIFILNYNGKHLLEDCLPSVVKAVETRGNIDEIIVIDNASTDDSIEFIKQYYPQIKIILKEKNNYLFSINKEVLKSDKEYFIFLNNDLKVDINFITPLLNYFFDKSIFAVGSKIFDWEGKNLQTGKRFISFKKFALDTWYDFNIQYPCYTLYASGGASAFDRKKFIDLGGFDELFKPGYLEDTDISYRAWKAGYKVIYSPESIVYHKGRVTLGKQFKNIEIDKIFLRNRLYFTWKNISDIHLLLPHILLLPYRLLRFISTKPALGYEYFKTILRCLHILIKRKNGEKFKITDKEAFKLINDMEIITIKENSKIC